MFMDFLRVDYLVLNVYGFSCYNDQHTDKYPRERGIYNQNFIRKLNDGITGKTDTEFKTG